MAKPTLYRDNSTPKNLLEVLQAAVIKRYSKPYGGGEPIVYEFTQDRALIHQYHVLLETMYRRMHNVHNFRADVDVYDKISHILIARRGRLCLGGCRLTVREYDEMWSLPLESENFNLRQLFPAFPLDRERHGELSRFVVMEDCGDRDILYIMCKMMYEKVADLQVHYLFARSYYNLARNWRLIANSLGAKTTRICEGIEVPDYPGAPGQKMYITLSDLSSLHKPSEAAQEVRAESIERNFETSIEKPRLALVD